jgi:excisionase family DNA binding protein
MPRSTSKPQAKPRSASSATDAWPEVLTLAEAAAYLRVPEAEIVRLVGPQGLPGRLIGSEWRFSRAALQQWLQAPSGPSSREALRSLAGSWKDDPHIEELLQDIYQRRGRPMTEGNA